MDHKKYICINVEVVKCFNWLSFLRFCVNDSSHWHESVMKSWQNGEKTALIKHNADDY